MEIFEVTSRFHGLKIRYIIQTLFSARENLGNFYRSVLSVKDFSVRKFSSELRPAGDCPNQFRRACVRLRTNAAWHFAGDLDSRRLFRILRAVPPRDALPVSAVRLVWRHKR